MKKTKLIVIIVLTFFSTGCSVKYNLKIDKDIAEENVVAILENNQENKKLSNILEKNKKSAYYDEDTNTSKYYTFTKSKKKNSNNLELKYSYRYPLEKLKYSNAISQCFYNKSVIKDKKYITVNTSEGVNCIYKDIEKQIDELTVSIETKYKLEETNADIIEKNKYIWNITSDNYKNKSIYLKVDYTKENIEKKKSNEKIVGICLFVFIILSIVIIFYFKIRSNKKYE